MADRRIAVVTGSTSGIGLGIAGRWPRPAHDIVLNGFGDADEIEELRAGLADEFGVEVAYQRRRHEQARRRSPTMVGDAIEASFGAIDILVNNAGIQHRRADRGIPAREVGRDPRDQPVGRLPRHPRTRCPA